jgi:hypothetical protein
MAHVSNSNDINKPMLKKLNSISNLDIKYKAPLLLQLYGCLNENGLDLENRYILTNFLDKYSDLVGITGDIYVENNKKSLNQLFLMAFRKAKDAGLLRELYEDYVDSFRAICHKVDLKEK